MVSTIGVVASVPAQAFGINVFSRPLREACDISDVMLSSAYAVGIVVSGAFLPLVGRLVDRHGARLIAVISG